MKITIFTSNQARHLSLIKSLASVADECYAVIEGSTVFPGKVDDFFRKSDVMQDYFSNVIDAERSIFGDIGLLPDNAHPLFVRMGDLNYLSRDTLKPFLDSDLYIVFGSSYIKGWLIDFLVSSKAINIHMGVSPYYRGSSCNFWALNNNDPHLVGSTIHLLSAGLDSGDMLYHAIPTLKDESPFEFTMKGVYAAHQSLMEKIADQSIFSIKPVKQDKSKEICYTRNSDFTDDVAAVFLDRNLTSSGLKKLINSKFDESLYLNPFYA
ncbi:MAG: methionyl-tRNA formyltransferase [Gammaproteobacteria bacterium]|nr:methionyl-tRNA formyltransferase [Gammaproteobacteria bacterium]